MPEAQDQAGNIWEVDAQGNPVRFLRKAGGGGRVYQDPYRARDEGRKDEDQSMERERLRLAQESADLARQRASVDAEEAARKRGTMDARGGVDSTESERTAAFLATRVAGGLQDLSKIGSIGAPTLKDALVGGTLLGNYTTDEDRQRAINAQRDILDAALTLGTGAAYTKEQIEAYRASYFPQPGDEPGTIRDKSTRLQRLLEAGKLKAGASAGMIDEALAQSLKPSDGAPTPGATVTPEYGLYDPSVAVSDNGPTAPGGTPSPNGFFTGDYSVGGIGRGLAQGVGSLVEGAASLPAIAIDPWYKPAVEAMGYQSGGISQDFRRSMGLPDNPNPISSAIQKGGAAALTGAGGAQAIARTLQPGAWQSALAAFGANPGQQLVGGSTGAAASEGTRQAGYGLPAQIAAGLLGGVAGGLGAALPARAAAQRQIEAAIPTVGQLKDQAGSLYRQAEARGITADPGMTRQVADDIRGVLTQEGKISPTGRISEVYPKAREAAQLIDDYAGQTMNPTQIQTVRGIMADGLSSPEAEERRLARLLTDEFDAWAAPQAPELAQARDVSSRYLNAQRLEQARELAGADASQFTGSGFENALRRRYRALDRNSILGRGRNGEGVDEAIQNVSRGTPMANAARALGRLAPTGGVSLTTGTIGPGAAIGALAGPVAGVAAGATMAGLGTAGRVAATRMGIRNADIAELVARNGGPIEQAPLIDADTEAAISAILANQAPIQGGMLGGGGEKRRKQQRR